VVQGKCRVTSGEGGGEPQRRTRMSRTITSMIVVTVLRKRGRTATRAMARFFGMIANAYATAAAVRSVFFGRTALRLSSEAPVGTIMPQAPSSAPA